MRNIPRKGQILGIIIIGLLLSGGFYRYYCLRISSAKATEIVVTEPLSPPESPELFLEEAEPALIKVHVVGSVAHPGVYTFEEGERIDAAVRLAAPTEEADLSLINLAAMLQDGSQIYVPKKGEEVARIVSTESPVQVPIRGKININRASLNELDTLKGIGPALAQRIIDYRKEQGPFASIEEITEVKGIGPALLEKICNDITV